MVAKAVRYHSSPFKGFCGVIQFKPLWTTIFNIIVEVVIQNWMIMVETKETVLEGLVIPIQRLVAYFYDKNILIVSTQAGCLQRAFNVLIQIFDCVSLNSNVKKTVIMVCQPCHYPGIMLIEVYTRWMKGEGPTYW